MNSPSQFKARTIAKTGTRIPVTGLDWRIVSATGEILKTPLPGGGAPNPYCAGFKRHDVNPVSGGPLGNTEDEQSVASPITFGKFRVLYLADFDWNQEVELMCPNNRIGIVDLFLVSRHGQLSSTQEWGFSAVSNATDYTSYDWSFGDGGTATNVGSEEQHVYCAKGAYTVTVVGHRRQGDVTGTRQITVE